MNVPLKCVFLQCNESAGNADILEEQQEQIEGSTGKYSENRITVKT